MYYLGEEIDITYSYWDGSGHRRHVKVRREGRRGEGGEGRGGEGRGEERRGEERRGEGRKTCCYSISPLGDYLCRGSGTVTV